MNKRVIKLLVIDDDDVDRLHIRRSLSTSGFAYELIECSNPEAAIDEVSKHIFDCIFLDYLLPGNNGLTVLKRIREIGIQTPIVITTSQGSESIAVDLMKAGASDYIIKNQINGTELGHILRSMLRMSRVERERQEAVMALKVSEARLAEAQKIAKIGNWEMDNVNDTCYWSPEVYNIFELKKEVITPSYENYLKIIHPEDFENVRSLIQSSTSGKNFNVDHRIVTPNGIKFVHVQGYSIVDQNQKLIKQFGTVQDITLRKLDEQEILRARELAENSLKVREVFLANMSHEIRTPMNAIIGFTQLLYETSLSGEQKSFVDAIHFSGENLLVVINDILDLSKIQSGKMTIEKIEFNLNDLLKGIITSLKRRANEKGLQLTFELGANVPNFVKGDPVRLNQILTNLISNGIKFTERGYVHLTVKCDAPTDKNFALEFAIKDTGIGIPVDKQSQVFESFVQASNETTRKFGGTGLGLTIVKNLVELQGGTIGLDSIFGYGSTFKVMLPYEKADQEIVQIRNQDVCNHESLHLLKRATILVAEDNHVNQLLVKRVLDKTGCTTIIVSNGLEAIESIKKAKYDLILMDIQMPEMDGYSATKHIRSLQGPLGEIPIIAMTAHALSSEVDKCISIGMNDYVSKPFKQEVLYSKIVKHLKKSDHLGIIPLHQTEESKAFAGVPPINLSPIDKVSNGDKHFTDSLIHLYEKQTPVFVEKLRDAVKNHNVRLLNTVCHQIKSSYGIVAMRELNQVLEEINTILISNKSENDERLAAFVNVVISLIQAITEEIRQNKRKTG